MKILHTSDLHFGIGLHGVSLLKYQWDFCDALCEIVRGNNIDAVIVSGDIYDTSVASAEAIRCWDNLTTKLCLENGIPVIACAGNHDGAARLASYSDLLKKAGLHISGKLEDVFEPAALADCEIYSLPYYNTADAATVLECEADTGIVMAEIVKRILEKADKSKKIILSAHCFAAGGKAGESDISARAAESVGGADLVPLSAFGGIDYVALGHLHRPQTLSKTGTIIRYSGTPMPYSFSEAAHNKTVSVYDTADGTVTEIEVPQPYKLKNITGTYDEIVSRAAEYADDDAFISIKVTDCPVRSHQRTELHNLYSNVLECKGTEVSVTGEASITAEQTSEFDPVRLAIQFSIDHRGKEPDEDELKWLMEAIAEEDEE